MEYFYFMLMTSEQCYFLAVIHMNPNFSFVFLYICICKKLYSQFLKPEHEVSSGPISILLDNTLSTLSK